MKKNSFFKRKFNFKTPSAFTLVEISVVIIIIGILLAGISQVFEMISEASLKSARTLSKASRITRTDDLALWLDATSDKAFDKEKDDNSTVSIWKDTNPKSTSPASSSSTLSSLYPSYILSGISSLPAVRFKKTSATVGNCVTIPSQSFVNNSEDFTLFLIYNPKSLDDGIILEKNNATATNFPFSLELNSGFYKFSVKNSANTIGITNPKQAIINTPNLIRLSRTKGSQIEITVNGVSSTQSDTLTSSTLNTTELAIGCRNGTSPTSFISGDIGEIAFFDRNLSVKEKADIDEYFYKKWKMKKFEGALASSELPCSVPSSANTDLSITTVQPTSIPQDILCKSGYSGTPKYTCINGTFNITSGSCNLSGCSVSSCANETYTGYSANFLSPCFNLSESIGATVNYGTTGINIYSIYSIRWRCNNNGTIDIDIEKNCEKPYEAQAQCVSRIHSNRCYLLSMINGIPVTVGQYFCCNRTFVLGASYNKSPCPWHN